MLSAMGLCAYVPIFFAVVVTKQAVAYPKGPGCGALLTNSIVGSRIEPHSSLNASFDENHALLNSSNAWCSEYSNIQHTLQVILDKPAILSGFEMQGRSNSDQYVKEVKIRYKPDIRSQTVFRFYPSNANQKTFIYSPTMDGDEIVYFPLNGTTMQHIIFQPYQWNNHICMRFELYGCVIVDGGFTSWSNWTRCSNPCGKGTTFRYRTCSNPAPLNSGQDCVGDLFEMMECEGQECPADGGFSEWSTWTACSVSCGTGFQLRHRACTNPPPAHGGQNCEISNSTEGRTCTIKDCQSQEGSGNTGARTSGEAEKEKDNTYFISMVVFVVAFAFSVIIGVAVCCVLRDGSKQTRNIHNKSSTGIENGQIEGRFEYVADVLKT